MVVCLRFQENWREFYLCKIFYSNCILNGIKGVLIKHKIARNVRVKNKIATCTNLFIMPADRKCNRVKIKKIVLQTCL